MELMANPGVAIKLNLRRQRELRRTSVRVGARSLARAQQSRRIRRYRSPARGSAQWRMLVAWTPGLETEMQRVAQPLAPAPAPSPCLRLGDAISWLQAGSTLSLLWTTPHSWTFCIIILSSSLVTSPSIHGAPTMWGLAFRRVHTVPGSSRGGAWGEDSGRECDSCTFRWHLSL